MVSSKLRMRRICNSIPDRSGFASGFLSHDDQIAQEASTAAGSSAYTNERMNGDADQRPG
jgi:hypothetical protein